jgi:parallel beta-helix repeat protein
MPETPQPSKISPMPLVTSLALGLMASNILLAQPSGGPYGPIPQTYNIPTVRGKIYYVAPDGKAEASGEKLTAPTTLANAIKCARTGDAIILRGGTYRTGNLIFNQGLIIQPYLNEQPILKGTYIAKDWQNLGNGLWVTKWRYLFPSHPASWWNRDREGKITPLHRFHNDMVFIDGQFLQSVGWEGEVNENSYYINYKTGQVYIGVDPEQHFIEITAFDAAFIRTTKEVNGIKPDRVGPTIRGLVLTQYAYRALEIEGVEPEGPAPEASFGKDVVGTTIEHCTISYCSRVAGYLRGDHLTIRHCKVSDTSTEGIYIIASNDVLLEKNIFTRNNIENITGYYPAAVKIFNQSHRVTCRDNLVIDLPNSNGIWYDVGNVDGLFINNWIANVGNPQRQLSKERPWPSDNGFFFEISKGVICAGNVFVNCDQGLWILNSSNAQIYNNTFINSTACIGRNERQAAGDHFGWHASTGPDIPERAGHVLINNLFYGDENFTHPLLSVWQSRKLCHQPLPSQVKRLENNVFVSQCLYPDYAFVWWSLPNNCLAELKTLTELESSLSEIKLNQYYPQYAGALFKSRELHHFQLLSVFAGAPLPADILQLLNPVSKTAAYMGAYPQ